MVLLLYYLGTIKVLSRYSMHTTLAVKLPKIPDVSKREIEAFVREEKRQFGRRVSRAGTRPYTFTVKRLRAIYHPSDLAISIVNAMSDAISPGVSGGG